MSVLIPKTQAASANSIAGLENHVGRKLPESYLIFLKEHDGAKPESNVFKLGKNNTVDVDRFIPAHEMIHICSQVEGFPPRVLAIARAAGGNFVYLDPTSGAVYFWDHENDAADAKLADSFDKFLFGLEPFDISQIKLKPGQVKKIWVNPNFKPEFD